jgi:hypothetical protein
VEGPRHPGSRPGARETTAAVGWTPCGGVVPTFTSCACPCLPFAWSSSVPLQHST